MDPLLNFDTHIKHLEDILPPHARLHPAFSLADAVHAFVSSLQTTVTDSSEPLVRVSRDTVHQRCQDPDGGGGHDHITPILKCLHCLHVPPEWNTGSPPSFTGAFMYMPPLLPGTPHPETSSCTVLSITTNTFQDPRTKFCSMTEWPFFLCYPRPWNALPDQLKAPQTTDVWK